MNPDQKLIHVLKSKGYSGSFEQMMTEFIKHKTQNGNYEHVFSSHQPEPDPVEPVQDIKVAVQVTPAPNKPWYKKLFSKE